jgi:DNA-binding FrmR family transcriptional regulator
MTNFTQINDIIHGSICLTPTVLMPYHLAIPTPLGGGKRKEDICVWQIEVTMENEKTLRRLKTIEGHLKGVIRMVEEDAYCIDIIRQIQAVDAALNKVSSQILESHLNSCVITAIQGNNKAERERVLKEITEVFEMSTKV